jgi:hypothetical protein
MAAGFRIDELSWIDRPGVSGQVELSVTEDGLQLKETKGGHLIPFDRIVRLRSGVNRANQGESGGQKLTGPGSAARSSRRAFGWKASGDRCSSPQDDTCARTAIGRSAAWRPCSIRHGWNAGFSRERRHALVGMIFLPLVFALVVSVTALREDPPWQKIAVSFVPTIVVVVAILATRSSTPRRARNPDGFRAALWGGPLR